MRTGACIIAGVAVACATPSHRLAPAVPFEAVREDGVRARVVELVPPAAHRDGHVVVEIMNPTTRTVRVSQERLRFVGLAHSVVEGAAWPRSEGGGGGGGLGAINGGGFSGSGSGSGSAGGALLGAGSGLVALVLVVPWLLPGLVEVIKIASRDYPAPPEIGPGQTDRFDVPITMPAVGVEQHLTLGIALDSGRRPLDVPVIDATAPHGGWRPDHRIEHLGVRLGGGPIFGDGHYSGFGGIQLLSGGFVGPVQLRVGGTAGINFGGAIELGTAQYAFGHLLQWSPSIDLQAGYTLLGKTTYVSSSIGLELTLPVESKRILDLSLVGQRVGIYGKVGPTWTSDGRFARWEVGVSFR